jgi:hypothetical protein
VTRRSIEDFARGLGADSIRGDAFSFRCGGVAFAGRARRTSKGQLDGAFLEAAFEGRVTAATIVLRQEGRIDRLGKQLGINREFSAGDLAFDAQVYVEADVPDATLARIFRADAVRAATLDALGTDAFSWMRIEPEGKLVYCVPSWKLTEAAQVAHALASVKRLVDGLEAVPREAAGGYREGPFVLEKRLPSRRFAHFAVLGYVAALWIGTWLLHRPPTLDYAAVHAGLAAGALACLVHLPLLARVFRGRSTSFRNVILHAFLLVPTLLVAGSRIATWANAAFDRNPRETIPCELSVAHPSKGSPFFVAKVADGASTPIDLSFTAATRQPTITIGQGALGARWIESVQPVTNWP